MAIRQYKPTTAGRRQGSVSDFADCTNPKQNRPEKSLLRPKPKKGGRNNQGIVCTRFRGGGHKKMYRVIDFKRRKDGVWATVGTTNFDSRSFAHNEENNVCFCDAALAAKLERIFIEDMKGCDRVTLEKWESRGLVAKSVQAVVSLFQEQV